MNTPDVSNTGSHKKLNKHVWLVILLTVVSVGILIKLGFWQLERGNEKQRYEQHLAHQASQDSQPLISIIEQWNLMAMSENNDRASNKTSAEDKPSEINKNSATNKENVERSINGTQVDIEISSSKGLTLLLDNQTYQGAVGYVIYRLLPVKGVRPDTYLIIDLGFVKASKNRSDLPEIEIKALPQHLSGRLYIRSLNPFNTGLGWEDTHPIRIQSLNIAEIAQRTGTEILPVIFQPKSLTDWPYPLLWRPTAMKSEKHFGYSVQWFVMAGVLAGLMLMIGIRFLKTEAPD